MGGGGGGASWVTLVGEALWGLGLRWSSGGLLKGSGLPSPCTGPCPAANILSSLAGVTCSAPI